MWSKYLTHPLMKPLITISVKGRLFSQNVTHLLHVFPHEMHSLIQIQIKIYYITLFKTNLIRLLLNRE